MPRYIVGVLWHVEAPDGIGADDLLAPALDAMRDHPGVTGSHAMGPFLGVSEDEQENIEPQGIVLLTDPRGGSQRIERVCLFCGAGPDGHDCPA